MNAIFYDRKNKCEVSANDLLTIKLVESYAGVDDEGFSVGTPIHTVTKKYGHDCLFVGERIVSEFGYKSKNCPSYCNWDFHCNYSDLVFLRFE